MLKKYILLLAIVLPLQLFGQFADRAFINGKIYTANDDQPFVEAIAIIGDEIIFVGSNDDVDQHINVSTVIEDLEGRLVLPGIHDVHMHPLEAGSLTFGDCYLDPYEYFTEDLVDALAACNLEPNENGWIVGYGHSIFTLLEDGVIPRFALDEAFPDIPVVIMEETSHSVWVNSKGLEAAGIDSATPNPVGGHIIKHQGNGQPTGVLLDNAGDLVIHEALASAPTINALNYDGLVNFSLPLMAQNGITSACEARTYWKREYIETWKTVRDNGLLTARVILQPWVYPEDEDVDQIPILLSMFEDDDPFLRINQLKVYADGITINATAALHEPYDYSWNLPFEYGLNYIEVNRLSELIATLETSGFDFHIHAIGDRGVTEGLDAIEYARNLNGNVGARHRITHLEIVDPDDFQRFAQLNVTADMQVAGYWTQPNFWYLNEDFVGEERSDNLVPLKSLEMADAHITLSSDWDVSEITPFRGMQNALTRNPQEISSREAVVKAYTINGAYVMRQEEHTGSIEVGKWADFICVDQDIFTIPVNQIAATKVLSTWVGGVEVYRSDDLPVITDWEETIDESEAISISPNPASAVLYVKSTAGGIHTAEVVSSTGEIVWTAYGGGRDQLLVPVERVAPGAYFLKITSSTGEVLIQKFVRQL